MKLEFVRHGSWDFRLTYVKLSCCFNTLLITCLWTRTCQCLLRWLRKGLFNLLASDVQQLLMRVACVRMVESPEERRIRLNLVFQTMNQHHSRCFCMRAWRLRGLRGLRRWRRWRRWRRLRCCLNRHLVQRVAESLVATCTSKASLLKILKQLDRTRLNTSVTFRVAGFKVKLVVLWLSHWWCFGVGMCLHVLVGVGLCWHVLVVGWCVGRCVGQFLVFLRKVDAFGHNLSEFRSTCFANNG